MVKIAFFHNECTPYRIPTFERISNLPDIDLKVYFGRLRSFNRRWKIDRNFHFNHEILKDINTADSLFSLHPYIDPNPINPSLFLKLVAGKYDAYIGDEPWFIGSHVTFLVAKLLRKPFFLRTESIDKSDLSWDHATQRLIESSKKSYLAYFLSLPFRKKIATFPFLIRLIFSYIVLKCSDAYIVAGKATEAFLLKRGISPFKVFIAANAIDNKLFDFYRKKSLMEKEPERLKKRFGLEKKKVILYVGYLQERKGVQYLISAFVKLKKEDKDVALVVVGDGPYKKELIKICEKNHVDVIFAGHVSNPYPLVNYYLIADTFVLPTLEDVWGNVINEAMACGCPIVTTTNAGSFRDLVKNGINGYVVKPGNIAELYYAIKNVLYNTKLKRKMREKSREIIQNYSYDNNVLGYKSAIESVFKIRKTK